jgi:hypothetical protein
MALMNLLTAGRSLSEARERPHRYKLKTGAMPKFGKTSAQAASEETDAVVGAQAMKTQTVAEPVVQRPTRGVWERPGKFFKGSRPASVRRVVQGELSLDNVKPVRNDLSDTDLELVTVVKKPEPAPSAMKIDSVEVPVARGPTIFERVRGLFQRAS